MKPQFILRYRLLLAAGALITTTMVGAFTFVLTSSHSSPAQAHSWALVAASSPRIELGLKKQALGFNQRTKLRARLAGITGQRVVAVEFKPRNGEWQVLRSKIIAHNGAYRLGTHFKQSGLVRLSMRPAVTAAEALPDGADEATIYSQPRRISVRAKMSKHVKVVGKHNRVKGLLLPKAGVHRKVKLQMRTRKGWRTIDKGTTNANGRFRLHAQKRALAKPLRVRFAGDQTNAAAARRVQPPTADADGGPVLSGSFSSSVASWYGPGLYGNRTACGQTLSPGMMGVAHKTLPCGTMITFKHGGHAVRVPVIDRGPYVGGREWDLTGATAQALGVSGVAVVQHAY